MSPPAHDVTELLQAWGRGDLDAHQRVVALVHEAYLRLVDQRRAVWQNRAQLDLSARHGIRVDLRWHVTSNAVDTEVSARPLTINGTPVASLGSATTPSVTFTNNPNLRSSLSGPPITAFRTREGSGVQIDTAFTIGYVRRF